MTIGKNSKKSSVRSSIRAPKFLDKASGFYGRLDEPETSTEVRGNEEEERVDDRSDEGEVGSGSPPSVTHKSGADEEVFDFTDGMMEDDGETLLRRKPSRRSSRWRRSSRRKQKEDKAEEDDSSMKVEVDLKKMEEEKEEAGTQKEPALVHFPVREDADDQVLIRDKKRGREEEEGEEERKMKREQEEGMKMVKKHTVKSYRKAFDRALRRGWEAFITNLYSVTLTPVASSSPPSSSPSLKKRQQHSSVLAEFQ